ncbi:L-rhamnose mutarotase [Halobacillus salinarum]|uniref:L-rhamnose mutarotase n=1 Tax=Halobacillus salinarum TaxID=2932257 RepID=A0ABY4ELW6_9BACI|nr:L-rhamnose mutarotase [Halobacillus salinarum]UOQ44990.1 L-rhamnose mutarotase [Halobacillus salinarum]
MIRKASVMYVNKGSYEEYKRRHDELWPEMNAALKEHGAHNYSIFLNEQTGELFAYLEIEDEEKWEQMSGTDVCRRWWAYMADIMETNDDHSPVSVELKDMFYLP